ncbi:MAG: tyrosine-protein phosphatase [Sphingomonadales bacterium]|nr:tyrosine-protein phosphatase [Sphingomonadales bacterium]
MNTLKRLAALLALATLPVLPAVPVQAKAPPAQAEAVPEHPRFIPMAGGRNFRDAGGYRTASGKTVRWNVLYRSGSMGMLTPEGKMMLAGLHPEAIIDLRSTQERARDNGWIAQRPGYWSRDYSLSMGNLANPMAAGKPTAESMRAMMTLGYTQFPHEQAAGYRELFARLLKAKGPVVVNCSAGKDRTGVATALVLTALGVPYDTVRQDFLLSNGAPGMNTLLPSLGQSGPSPEVMAPIIGVEPGYLDTAFATIRKDYGSVDAYLTKELGVGPKQRAALRHRMLQ